MKIKSKFLLFTIVLLLVGLATVSATENVSDISETSDIGIGNEITDTNVIQQTDTDSVIQEINEDKTIGNNTNQEKIIEKSNNQESQIKGAGRVTTITSDFYDSFFVNKTKYIDLDGNEISDISGLIEGTDYVVTTSMGCSDFISNGDTINLKGTFESVTFGIDKQITLTSLDNDASLYNCDVYVHNSASGSTISNLKIVNSAGSVSGIVLDCANYITVENNDVRVNGTNAHAFDAVTNRSVIRSNYFQTTRTIASTNRTHTAMVFCSSWYNRILNNTVYCDGANCIYLSIYPGQTGLGHAGSSNYNNITGNTVYGANSGWSYTIQMFGSNNIASYNTVSGGFWGISSAGTNDTIDHNNIQGWQRGVSTGENTIVTNNKIEVTNSSVGVYIGGQNNEIRSNSISTENGYGIDIPLYGSVLIENNNITSTGSYGIYSKPTRQVSYVTIKNNNIHSNKEGIYFTKTSATSSKYVNDILVDNNLITSEADYAIDFINSGPNVASEINITVTSSNVLSSSTKTGFDAYLPPSKSSGTIDADTDQVINITSLNDYNKYFVDGTINTTLVNQNATIYLSGTYSNVDFTFTKKVHVIGQNAVIKNGTFTFSENAHASTITGVTIKNTKNDTTVHGIELLEVNNCEITDNVIENYGLFESLGIFVFSSNGNKISSNNIKTSGDYVNNGIFVYESLSNTIDDNTITINQSNVPYEYAGSVQFNDKVGTIQEILHNHGIVLIYSSSNTVNNNNIKSTSMFKSYTRPSSSCQNSIVGIDIYFDSNNNKVTNNVIDLDSYGPYTYGMGVLGGHWGTKITESNSTNNIFRNNKVTVKGGYFSTGFIAGRNSIDTTVDSNVFVIASRRNSYYYGDYAFAVTLENSTSSYVTNNNITLKAAAAYTMELFDSPDNTITNNKIVSTASYPYAIAGYRSSNNFIAQNNITLTKGSYGTVDSAAHADAIPYGDEAIMFMSTSTNNNITLNDIKTNANITVKLTEDTSDNYVEENALQSAVAYADDSVDNEGTSNTVQNNFLYFVYMDVVPVTAEIGDTINLTANVASTTSNVKNITVTFKIGVTEIGNATVSNGKAVLKYTIPTLFNPTSYTITASAGGNNFQNTTATALAIFTKQQELTTTKVNKVLSKVGTTATLTANITTEDGGKIGSGTAAFCVDDVVIAISNVRLGVASCNYTIDSDAECTLHTISVIYSGTNDYAASNGSNILGIQSVSEISMEDSTVTLGSVADLTATITSGGKAVENGQATIKINNTKIATVPVNLGIMTYTGIIPTSLNQGSTTMVVTFSGNDTMASATKRVSVKINPMQPIFEFNDTSVKVGDNVSLVLGITDGKGYAANGGNVSLKLNNVTLVDSAGKVISGAVKNGQISFTFTVPSGLSGYQNLTFMYAGNTKFAADEQTFNNALYVSSAEKSNVKLTVDSIASANLGDNVTITGTLTNEAGSALSNVNVKVSVNGVITTVKTNKSGIYSLGVVANTTGDNDVVVSYAGNSKYNPSSVSTTFSVKQDTIITVTPIENVNLNDKVVITGTLTSESGNALSSANVKVSVNGVKTTVKTNKTGVYSLTVVANTTGTNEIVVSYAGNAKFNPSSVSTTFTIIQDTILKVNSIGTVKLNDKVVITGTLTSESGNALSSANVKVSVNGVKTTVKTNKSGAYSLSVVAETTGTNKVVVTYAGNAKFNPSSVSTTFTVNEDTTKKNTIITVDSISNVELNDNVVITGKLTNEAGSALSGANVKVSINGVKYSVKTDKTGVYSLTVVANTTGTNEIVVTYTGNSKYNPSTAKTNFTIKQDTVLTISKISNVKLNNNVTITGTLKSQAGNVLKSANVKINLNGVTTKVKTNSKGVYTYTTTANVSGTNNVTVTYAGNTKFYKSTKSTTFTVS